jgi:hypothetical protein
MGLRRTLLWATRTKIWTRSSAAVEDEKTTTMMLLQSGEVTVELKKVSSDFRVKRDVNLFVLQDHHNNASLQGLRPNSSADSAGNSVPKNNNHPKLMVAPRRIHSDYDTILTMLTKMTFMHMQCRIFLLISPIFGGFNGKN